MKKTKEEEYAEHLENTYVELNKVSSSFCVAKWKQVTLHLQNGHCTTQSLKRVNVN